MRDAIAAIVLAAGCSRRMGTNKLLLPFGGTTVVEHVVNVLVSCEVDEVVVVTGYEHDKIQATLSVAPVRFAHNADYAQGEMFSSIQTGLRALGPACIAALITPGDQPLLEARLIAQVIAAYAPGSILIPSYRRRGGHPILIDRQHWPAILNAPPGATLRDITRTRASSVQYVEVDTASVLYDMDTPEQYQAILKMRWSPP